MTIPATATTTATLDLDAIASRYLDAWERRDADAIGELHTADTRFWLHDDSQPVDGRAATRDAFAALFEMFADFSFDVHRVLYGPDFWVLDWTATATLDGSPIRFDALDVVTVDERGLVARKDTFVDAAHLRNQAPTGT